MVAAKEALEEIKTSSKFANILELILLMGNILNTGSRNAQSIGFDISFLPKVNFLTRLDMLIKDGLGVLYPLYQGWTVYNRILLNLNDKKKNKLSVETDYQEIITCSELILNAEKT